MNQTVIFPARDSGNSIPSIKRVRSSWAAVMIGVLCLALLLGVVGVSPAMAETPAPCICLVVIPLQEASMTHYADGSRQTVQVAGEISVDADGSAIGTINITAAGELVERLTASRLSDVITDESGDIVSANLLARTASDPDVMVSADLNSYDQRQIVVGDKYTISGAIDAATGKTTTFYFFAKEIEP